MTEAQTIQPVGFHVGVSGEWLVTTASANLGQFLGIGADDALGQPFTALFSNDVIHAIRNRMALLRGDDAVEHLFQFSLVADRPAFDLALYRTGSGFGIDVEPCDERSFGDATGILAGMLSRVEPSGDIAQLCNQASNQLRALTGFQQVVISTGSKTLGESVRGPALCVAHSGITVSDVVVFDREAAPVPIHGHNAAPPRRLTLRSPTQAMVSELEAIGASAALVVPLRRDGREWGQAACYHRSPRHVSAERRNIARLFASIMSMRIEIAELRRGS